MGTIFSGNNGLRKARDESLVSTRLNLIMRVYLETNFDRTFHNRACPNETFVKKVNLIFFIQVYF